MNDQTENRNRIFFASTVAEETGEQQPNTFFKPGRYIVILQLTDLNPNDASAPSDKTDAVHSAGEDDFYPFYG